MAVAADDIALRHLALQLRDGGTLIDQEADFVDLLTSDVVEIEHYEVGFTTVRTSCVLEPREQILPSEFHSSAPIASHLIPMPLSSRSEVGLEARSTPVLAPVLRVAVEGFDRKAPPTATATLQVP
jgi:hypothetical protein